MQTNTRNIVRLMVIDGSRLLVAQVISKAFFFLPGGGIEHNESLVAAARRELREELGISPTQVSTVDVIGVFEHTWDDKGHPFHEMNFICKCQIDGLTARVQPVSTETHLRFSWVDVDDIKSLDFRPDEFKTYIPAWILANKAKFFASSMADI